MRALRVPSGGHLVVRCVHTDVLDLAFERGTLQPITSGEDAGAMVVASLPGGMGYAASAGLSAPALADAAARALEWARLSVRLGLFQDVDLPLPAVRGLHRSAHARAPLPELEGLIALLDAESQAMAAAGARIVHWAASARATRTRHRLYLDGDCVGEQSFSFVEPSLEATAADAGRAQTRSLAGQYNGFCRQGGFEVIAQSGLVGGGARVADEALQLLSAPNCPEGRMSVLLMPDQMMLQIHESIGHPLELDRILGDERNFAGTSFVDLSMFGTHRYGSELLDVSFDPGDPTQLASYDLDDEGTPARKTMLIERGILKRPIGGRLSCARARALGHALEPVAAARACGWHRPVIDRMANLNIEPGDAPLARMIAGIEHGVLMRTNVSWSIDDSRNKFQFGCEWGQLIRDGTLGPVVRNPNYRGVSASFWRSLVQVGDASTFETMGTPFCGKGEPGQVIRVGHASPACRFDDVDVFGAEE